MRASGVAAVFLGVLVASWGVAPRAEATPIGPSCGTCQGSTYDLSYTGVPISSSGGVDTWEITMTINTSGYNGGGSFIDSVALKVSSELLGADLISAPGGVMNWVEILGGLNGSGCNGNGSGFDCAMVMAINPSVAVPNGTPYTWVFHLDIASGGLFTGIDTSSIKARYVDPRRRKVGALVSENLTLTQVPEPGSAILLLLGTSMLAARHRREPLARRSPLAR
jgi:PEP-CTERM motif